MSEGTTRRGTDTPVHHPDNPAGSTYSWTRGLRLPEQLKRQPQFYSSDKTRHDSPVPTLQGPCSRSQNRRGSLRFLPPLEVRPSSVAPDPVESREAPPTPQDPSPLRGTLGSSLRSPARRQHSQRPRSGRADTRQVESRLPRPADLYAFLFTALDLSHG